MKKKFYRYKRFWLLMFTAAYLLVGYFYLPKIIQQQLKQQLKSSLNMHAEMSEISFNPLTFSTDITDFNLTDTNQQNWYSSQSTSINFDPINLLWGQWKFSDLNLVQPNITLLTNESGQVIIPALPDFKTDSEQEQTIDLVIDDISLEQGQLNLQANNIKKDFSLNFKQIEFSHEKLSLVDEDTRFDIVITTEFDEVLSLNGHYNHIQEKIETELTFNDWQATTLNKFVPDDLMIKNQAGSIQANGNLKWILSQKPQIEFANIELSGWQTSWQNEVHLEGLQASILGAQIDTEQQTITIEKFQSMQGNWQVMWPVTLAQENTNMNTPGSEPVLAWQVVIKHIQAESWPVLMTDTALNETLSIIIQSLALTGSNNQAEPFQLTSQINMSQGGELTINSEQTFSPTSLVSDITLSNLSIPQLSPWITDHTGLVVSQGLLNTTQNIQMVNDHVRLTGDLSVTDANITNQGNQDIATIGQLLIGTTTVSSENKTIVIDQITLDQASGNIIIDADKNINIQNLTPDQHNETGTTDTASDWVIKVGSVNIKDTSTALIDQSVEPAVTTSISELNGAIKGLSSENLSKADVAITGKFNQFSPLSIEGQINPLSSEAYTDIKVLIEDLDLLGFSPYAATYLAFPINGGKLNLELEYILNQDELRGKNNFLFKQFKLGDRNSSSEAINLPLKLAVSLLSDMNGEMKIDLPVSGNINDPEFSYGGLVGKAFFKLITSIVASPFKILGALIPNPDPNLSEIQFTAGQAELLASEQNKLKQIAEIMTKKPGLNLQLNPHISENFDRAAMQSLMLLSQAPFEQLDFSDPNTTEWISAQATPEQVAMFTTESVVDYDQLWQSLVAKQTVSQEAIDALTQQRNLSIKNYLIETAGIAAEKIFIEQAETTESNLALIKIGVSR